MGAGMGASASRYPQLESVLGTEEGFRRSIRYTSGADTALLGVLLFAVFGVVYNVLSTLDTIDGSSRLTVRDDFWFMFFVVRGESGNISPIIWAMVWLPVIAVPVMLGLLIYSRATRGGAILKVYEQYRRAGFVAELMATGVSVNLNNSFGPLYALASPNVPPDWMPAAIQQLRGQSVDRLSGAVATGFGKQAVQGKVVDPSLPEGIFITGQAKNNKSTVRIAVPIGDDYTRLKLWPLQKDAPLA